MSGTDLSGRPYATVDEVQPGTVVEVDEEFTCINACEQRTVLEDHNGLYIRCDHGHHYLDGQISDDETHYVGVYLVRD